MSAVDVITAVSSVYGELTAGILRSMTCDVGRLLLLENTRTQFTTLFKTNFISLLINVDYTQRFALMVKK